MKYNNMETKFTKEKWISTFGIDKVRGVRYKGGFICKLMKPEHYPGQDERYEKELEEYKANAELIAAAPELYEALSRLVFLHECEQEGLSSGQPTPEMWFEAVNKASEVLTKINQTNVK